MRGKKAQRHTKAPKYSHEHYPCQPHRNMSNVQQEVNGEQTVMYLYDGILPSIEINYGNMDKSSPKNYTECKTLDKRAMYLYMKSYNSKLI